MMLRWWVVVGSGEDWLPLLTIFFAVGQIIKPFAEGIGVMAIIRAGNFSKS
jgi:hypothetical protein